MWEFILLDSYHYKIPFRLSFPRVRMTFLVYFYSILNVAWDVLEKKAWSFWTFLGFLDKKKDKMYRMLATLGNIL